jgi:hypothetical protein
VVDDAIAIGRRVRKQGYETQVRGGGQCDSACPLIWLSATQRYLGRTARLGFHSARQGLWPDRYEPGNKTIRDYLTELGDVPPGLIKLVPKANPDQIAYLDRDTALAWGLIKGGKHLDRSPWEAIFAITREPPLSPPPSHWHEGLLENPNIVRP